MNSMSIKLLFCSVFLTLQVSVCFGKVPEGYLIESRPLKGISIKEGKKVATIVGAGPTGLMSALVLEKAGWEVVVFEKRKELNRHNMVNLKVEIQSLLRELELIDDFETHFASKLDYHFDFFVKEAAAHARVENTTDMSKVILDRKLEFSPLMVRDMFGGDGNVISFGSRHP